MQRGSHNTAWIEGKRANWSLRARTRPGWTSSAEDVGWSGRRSGIAQAGPVTRCCMARPDRQPCRGRRRQVDRSPPTCTGTPRPPVRCSKRRSGPNSPAPSGSSGGPGGMPGSPASRQSCWMCSRSGAPRSKRGWKQPAEQPARQVSNKRCWPPDGTSRNGKGSVSTPPGRPRPPTPGGAQPRPRRWRRDGDQRARSDRRGVAPRRHRVRRGRPGG